MNSVWTETVKVKEFPKLQRNIKTDVLIIGGGITGLLCAYYLQQSGIDYILVEADRICSGVTQNTTAKITVQHGLVYHKLVQRFGIEKASLYLHANELALEKYKNLCKNISCDFEEKDSFVYARESFYLLEQEMKALDRIGYKAEYIENLSLPIDTIGAVKFSNQAQFHPLLFLTEIARGLNIYEHTKVVEVTDHNVKTTNGEIDAECVVVATHFPIFNKHGAYFLKMYQRRSYVIALENAQKLNGMYLDEAEDGMSFRNYKDLLLLGGGGHRTGKSGGNWKELYDFASNYYPGFREKYSWATQDCMTLDRVPYIGRYGGNIENYYVATGFNKWGMTSAMVSAMLIRDFILNRENAYMEVFSPQRTMMRKQLFLNAFEATKNLLTFSEHRCPHMGCALKWNRVEQTWDCACHGSRFHASGELINNPATDDLKIN